MITPDHISAKKTKSDDALGHLNKAQRLAVTHEGGPMMVIAGAGTGKTAVITERIAWLIRERGARPDSILALTFTERAASEMEERVDRVLPIGYSRVWIETFHGFCERILRDYAMEIGLDPSFKILASSEQWMLLRRHLFELPLNHFRPLSNPTKFLQSLVSSVSAAKDQDIPPERFDEYAQEFKEKAKKESDESTVAAYMEEATRWHEFADHYRAINKIYLKEGVMDFADLILNTIRLFRKRPSVLKRIRDNLTEVLVDEFQDTNGAQNELVRLLVPSSSGNITVVGDDDQSIYAWRGSNIANILQFQQTYPDATKIVLTENYRSPQRILDTAYTLIQQNNPYRLENKAGVNKRLTAALYSDSGKQIEETENEVRHFRFTTIQEESTFICSTIRRIVEQGEYTYHDIAVLMRTNAQSDDIIPAFMRWEIPYHVSEARGLLGRPEIRDISSWLRLAVDPHDTVSAYRVLSLPTLDIPPNERQRLFFHANKQNKPILDVFRSWVDETKESTLSLLLEILDEHTAAAPRMLPSKAIYQFLEKSGYLKWCQVQSEVHPEFFPNIGKFLSFASDYEQSDTNPSIQGFVEYLDVVLASGDSPSQAEVQDDVDAVRMLTVHGAKGLEFPIVFLPGVSADKYPIRRRTNLIEVPSFSEEESLQDPRDVHQQEERRLFYVAITRARNRLFITSAERSKTGKTRRKPSPFLVEGQITTEETEMHPTNQQALPLAPPSDSVPAVRSLVLPNKFSVSQINTYHRCPLQYKFQYIYQVPTPPVAAMTFGITIHNVLNAVAKQVAEGKCVQHEDVEILYEKYWRSTGYQGIKHEQQQKEEGSKMLHKYLADRPHILSTKPLYSEEPFRFIIEGSSIVGRIDRVDVGKDNTVIVTDFKTGSSRKQKDADKDLQLSVYALALKEVFNLVTRQLTLSYIKDNVDVHTVRSESDLADTRSILTDTAEQIRSGEFQSKPDPYTCGSCSFRTICDYSAI